MVIFHCYVSSPEGSLFLAWSISFLNWIYHDLPTTNGTSSRSKLLRYDATLVVWCYLDFPLNYKERTISLWHGLFALALTFWVYLVEDISIWIYVRIYIYVQYMCIISTVCTMIYHSTTVNAQHLHGLFDLFSSVLVCQPHLKPSGLAHVRTWGQWATPVLVDVF